MHTTTQTTGSPWRQLDERSTGGIDVELLWDPDTDTVAVLVGDDVTDVELLVEVPPDRDPLWAFHHPYIAAAELPHRVV